MTVYAEAVHVGHKQTPSLCGASIDVRKGERGGNSAWSGCGECLPWHGVGNRQVEPKGETKRSRSKRDDACTKDGSGERESSHGGTVE